MSKNKNKKKKVNIKAIIVKTIWFICAGIMILALLTPLVLGVIEFITLK